MKVRVLAGGAAAALFVCGGASAQDQWRTVDPARLLVIDTTKGRVLAELEPGMAPAHVQRVGALADQGFYDGAPFHRVMTGFMAQTGDPTGTGQGGSDLPDLAPEFTFRRTAAHPFTLVPGAGAGVVGMFGSMPVTTQPDAQMMFTVDKSVPAAGLFCPGVVGMARAEGLDSANSQFFLMTGRTDALNGKYTPFGRVLHGMDVVRALKAGPDAENGIVRDAPDRLVRVRLAASLPEAERPTVRVMTATSPTFAASVETVRAQRGSQFHICDLMPAVEVTP